VRTPSTMTMRSFIVFQFVPGSLFARTALSTQ
jgi:hypothetical protein